MSRRGRAVALAGLLGALGCVWAGATGIVGRRAAAQSGLSASNFVLEWAKGASSGCAAPGGCSSALPDQGNPIALSSPMVASLDATGPSVVVGDRAGYLYAYHLADGGAVGGWPVNVGAPIDSTPSVAVLSASPYDSVFVGAGNAAHPDVGGYYAYKPGGSPLWNYSVLHSGPFSKVATGVQASLTVANLQGTTAVSAGSLGQLSYALSAAGGSALSGWPFFDADSVFSTAAAADLYGDGQQELVVGGASTAGLAIGQAYSNGGHVRILNAGGQLLYDYNTNQEVDSSPAVGDFLQGGQPGIVVGTGSYFKGASDTDTLKAFTNRLQLVWSDTLDGLTGSSPALADVFGTGQTDVVEGTDSGSSGGSVYVLDGATGATIWQSQNLPGRVIGSVVTANLSGSGAEDLLVPTTQGVFVFACTTSPETCSEVTVLGGREPYLPGSPFGFQNAPLVTADRNGAAGITIAGYNGYNHGVILHYEVTGSSGTAAVGPGTWPMFHHDQSLSGASAPLPATGTVSPAGLSAVAGDGQVTLTWQPPAGQVTGYNVYETTSAGNFAGQQPLNGATPLSANTYTVTGLANGKVYFFEVTALNPAGEGAPTGEVPQTPFGPPTAPSSLAATAGNGQVTLSWSPPAANGGRPVTGYNVYISPTAGQEGTKVASVAGTTYTATGLSNDTTYYFEVTATNVLGEGPASPQVAVAPVASSPGAPGSPTSPGPVPTTTVPPTTTTTLPALPAVPLGYRVATAGGQVSAFGKVPSLKGGKAVSPVVGLASAPGAKGYWLAEADGGVVVGGDAHSYGSPASLHVRLNKPIVGIASTPDGKGYWLVASDGGVFPFGDARFYGSTGHIRLNKPIVGIASTPDGKGYWLVASDGGVFPFGDAPFMGSLGAKHLAQAVVGIAQ